MNLDLLRHGTLERFVFLYLLQLLLPLLRGLLHRLEAPNTMLSSRQYLYWQFKQLKEAVTHTCHC